MNDKDPSKFSWGLILIVTGCAALCAFFTYFPLTDADIFWHLAAGREMVAHRHFLRIDPFSFTLASAQWIDLHWFFQLLVYGLYALGAEKALLIFKLALIGLVAFLLCRTFPSKRYALIASACMPLVFFEVRYLIDVRPVLITMLCMALYVFLFEHARRTGKKRLLWWCLPLQVIWTNSQGLYMIGLFIIGAYWFEDLVTYYKKKEAKPAVTNLVFLSCILSCILNPYGIAGLLLPLKLISRINPSANNIYSMNISENVPLFSLTGQETIYRATVLCIAIVAGVLFLFNRRKMRIAQLVLFAGFFVLACIALRNALLFILIAIPIVGYNATFGKFGDYYCNARKDTRMRICWTLLVAFTVVLTADIYSHVKIITTFPPNRMISPFRFPEKIVERLKQNPVPGEMFNDIRYGGYLIWRFYPGKKVFIDTRLIIRSPRFFAEYLRLCDDPALFSQVAGKFNITQAILPSAIFPLYFKLIKWLYQSREWHLQYTDGASVLFVKNGASVGPRVDLSDTNSLKAVVDDINQQWEHSEFVRQEAYGYFIDLVKYLGLQKSADFIRNQTSLKEF